MDADALQLLWNNINLFMSHLPKPGILMVCGDGRGRLNLMTLGWMSFGMMWNEPVVTILVRQSRFSHALIMQNAHWTLNVMPSRFNETLDFCGRTSGRYADKFAQTALVKKPSSVVNIPCLRDAVVSLECSLINHAPMSPAGLSDLINARYYKDGDYHDYLTAAIKKIKIN